MPHWDRKEKRLCNVNYRASSQLWRAPGQDKGKQTLKVSVKTNKQTNKRDRRTEIGEPTMSQFNDCKLCDGPMLVCDITS